jgi:diguanylate cyclase (GGDEF)-like protein
LTEETQYPLPGSSNNGTSPLRVLVADDCSTTRSVLKLALRDWDCEAVLASDGEEAMAALQAEDAPRLAILDWMMPKKDGLKVCRVLRQQAEGPYIYAIVLTAKSAQEDLIAALDAGADDFLIKPVNLEELEQRIRAGRRILDLQDRLLVTQERLRHQATHDPLTCVWNRSAALERLDEELNRGQRTSRSTSLIMIDLDHLKYVNDTFGHLVGDDVLREATRRMSNELRSYDTFGRYGGEEFVVILPETSQEHAWLVAERLRTCLSDEPIEADGQRLRVTASLGIATFTLGQKDGPMLIQAADEAMYRAKSEGRNKICSAGELALPDDMGASSEELTLSDRCASQS